MVQQSLAKTPIHFAADACLGFGVYVGLSVATLGPCAAAGLFGMPTALPVLPFELAALPLLARGSALRFLLTRLYDWLNQTEGALVRPKDPIEYLKKLRFHRGIEGPAAYGIDP